jgi:hypothetical protein
MEIGDILEYVGGKYIGIYSGLRIEDHTYIVRWVNVEDTRHLNASYRSLEYSFMYWRKI